MSIKYDDFDLQIEPAGEKFRVRLLNAPTGQATTEFALPFTEIEVANFLSRIGQVRRIMRRLDAPELQAAKEFGGKLFGAVFSGEMIAQLRGSMEQASDKDHGLRIRLRLTDVPELADLPWEFLYDANQNHFLTTSSETPVVRFLDLPQRITPLRVALPLRVLVTIASPRNLKRLDTEGEWQRLQESLGDLVGAGQLVLERLPAATLDALRLRARGAPFHIFHFIGHGGFDDAAQDGVLQFEDETGMSYPVRGELLGMQLHDHRSLRLAVLNACEGARSSRQDPFSGVAQSLLQQRVPAVIAMQFEISDAAAKVFAAEFYRAVAEGSPVDAAVCESRKALFKEEFGQEWATPVLYMRSPEGQLFELQAVAAPPLPDDTLKKRQAEEAERRAAARAVTERQAAEKAEAESLAAQKAEADRLAKSEKERLANEKAEQDQLALAKAEAVRQTAAKAEAERAANTERERQASEAAEKARLVHQQEEAERRAREQTEFENLQREKKEAEQQRHEKEVAAGIPGHLRDNLRPRPDRRVWLALLAIPVLGIAIWGVRTYETRRAGLGDSEGPYQEGETLRAEKNFDGAIVAYREAIRARPEFPAAHLGLGIALRDKGDLNNAATEFREVLHERPSDAGAHNALGLTLFRAGDFNGAATEYQEFMRLNPQDAEAHYNLANALEKKGDREGATAEYHEVLRLRPDFAQTHPMPEFSVAEKPSSGGGVPDSPAGPPAVVQPVTKTLVNSKPVPQGGQVQAARLVKRVDPVYPSAAAQAHVTGMVRLHAIISKTGEVREVDVISGHPLLLQSAMSAVKQWRYRPTFLNGRPVEVETTIVVEFSLTGLASSAATDVKTPSEPSGKTGPVTQPPMAQSVCSFGNIEFSEQGNRLIGTVPYTYQGNYPLDSVALLGVPWTKAKQQVPGLSYGEFTLKTASGKASFSIEGRPTLKGKEEESAYLVISIVTKGDNKVVCGKIVPYQKKW